MPADDGMTVAKVTERLEVAVSALYRHLPGRRAALNQVAA
jgi:AcrR family transcriptional regulator